MKKSRYIAEQELIVTLEGKPKNVVIRIGEPRLATDKDGWQSWECDLQLEGLYELSKPVGGLTSFDAMMLAFMSAYQLLRDVVGAKGKVTSIGLRTPSPPEPEDIVSLYELFHFGGIK